MRLIVCLLVKYLMHHWTHFYKTLTTESVDVPPQLRTFWIQSDFRWLPQQIELSKYKNCYSSIVMGVYIHCKDMILILGVLVAEGHFSYIL